jgi:hypothetical protein
MVSKKPKPAPKADKPVRKRTSRDFVQRGHDTVREVERRHAERHKDE